MLVVIEGRGTWLVGGKVAPQTAKGRAELELETAPESLTLGCAGGEGRLEGVRFFRKQDSPWNSRFFSNLQEFCTVRSEFPYLSFLNFGKTLTTREPINRIIRRGIGPSLSVMLPVFLGELVLGIALVLVQRRFGLVPMPGNFMVSAYPVVLKASDILWTVAGVAGVGYLMAFIPARKLDSGAERQHGRPA